MDTLTPAQRSEIMGRVRATNTRPELAVRRLLHRMGYRFRLHRADLPGKPDIVLPRYRIAIFVHGCFWHGHRCRRGRRPTSNTAFWSRKLDANMRRDLAVRRALRRLGWRPIAIWECSIRSHGLEKRLGDFIGKTRKDSE
jgi:DNA mismatch endonuclease (patch repair protein)